MALVFGLILLTVPFGRVVAHSVYRLTPEAVTREAPVPADVVDLAQLPTGVLLRHQDGRLSWLDGDDVLHALDLPAPCLQLGYRQRLTAACALGDAGLVVVDSSAEGLPRVRPVVLDGAVTAVMVVGARLVAGLEDGRVVVFEAGETIERLGELAVAEGPIVAVAVPAGLIAATTGDELVVIDAAVEDAMRVTGRVGLGGPAGVVDYVDQTVYALAGPAGVVLADTSDGGRPVVVARMATEGEAHDLHISTRTVIFVVQDGPTRALRDTLNGQRWWGPPREPVASTRACAGSWGGLTCITRDDRVQRYDIFASKDVIIVLVGIAVGLLILAAIAWILWRRPEGWPWRLAFSLVAIGLSVWMLSGSYKVPIEAMHILEYTALGALAYRALALGGRGGLSTAMLALLFGLAAGLTDETIQWAHPQRTGAFEDGLLDTRAASIGVLLGWLGLRLGGRGRPLPWAVVPLAGAVAVLWVGFFQQAATGFGHLHHEGRYTFTSRLTRDAIAAIDEADTEERHRMLLQASHLPYGEFLRRVEARDPFLYEVAVHTYRRDRRFSKGDLPVACGEQRLIDILYPNTVDGTPMAWGPEQRSACDDVPVEAYVSPVSEDLITLAPPWLWWTGFGGVAALLAAVGVGLGFRSRRP